MAYNRPLTKDGKEDKRYPSNWNALRFAIFKEYNYKCAKCQRYSKGNLQLHHIVPLGLGGSNNKSNLVPLCKKCHEAVHFYNKDEDE